VPAHNVGVRIRLRSPQAKITLFTVVSELPWELGLRQEGIAYDAAGTLGAEFVSEFRDIDRYAAPCCAGSTVTPRAGEIASTGKTAVLPASWPLLPLRDGRRFACGMGYCRSPFAL